MYPDNLKRIGEHNSVAEELLAEIPGLEQKCRAVEKAVKENYFTLGEALRNYGVSEMEYIPYILLKNNQKFKRTKKQDQVFDAISLVVSVFDFSNFSLAGKQALGEIEEISKRTLPNSKFLIR